MTERTRHAVARRVGLPAIAALLAVAPLHAADMSAVNRAHLVVADSDVLGYYLYASDECELSAAVLEGMVDGVMAGRGLQPEIDTYSAEGVNLDLSVNCLEPDAEGLAVFSIDAAFSLVQADESDLLVNHTYGTFGEGDKRFIGDVVLQIVNEAITDFTIANGRQDEPLTAPAAPAAAEPYPIDGVMI